MKSSKRLDDIMYIKKWLLLQKKCSMIYSISSPKAEEGWIKPDQYQVNSMWLELTYYKYRNLIWYFKNFVFGDRMIA